MKAKITKFSGFLMTISFVFIILYILFLILFKNFMQNITLVFLSLLGSTLIYLFFFDVEIK